MKIEPSIHEHLSKKKTRMLLLYPPMVLVVIEMLVIYSPLIFGVKLPMWILPVFLSSVAYMGLCLIIILWSDYKRDIKKFNA